MPRANHQTSRPALHDTAPEIRETEPPPVARMRASQILEGKHMNTMGNRDKQGREKKKPKAPPKPVK